MDFSEALKAMRIGSKVAREKWRGRKSYWEIRSDEFDEEIIYCGWPSGDAKRIETVNDNDILADDWWILP